ncbi:MAG: hypothetical protein D6707_11380 [Bacteroidetes bacterium]|nr:MAG: hypothetical protein D6707_11380 [Bacteroidota bacterium]
MFSFFFTFEILFHALKKHILYILFLFLIEGAFGQYNTIRVVLVSGGRVNFNFNSINDYKNGKTDTEGTLIGVSLADADPLDGVTVDGFEIYANTPSAVIQGENPVNTLPLSTIELTPAAVSGFATTVFTAGGPLVTGTGPLPPAGPTGLLLARCRSTTGCTDVPLSSVTDIFRVTYSCGTTALNNLLGQPADYYTVEISYWVWPQCGAGDCP